MAEITMTVRQIMNLGLWDKVCEYKGWDEWILNEGRIDENEDVTFDDTFEKPKGEFVQPTKIELVGSVSIIESESQGHFWEYGDVENEKTSLTEELLKYKEGQKVKVTIEIIE